MSDWKVQVVTINSIDKHPNADRLEIANVLNGWQCVVQKGKHNVGQKVVYIPIDSILPEELEERIFGVGSKVKLNKHRVRTIKLRGQISQGLIVPMEGFVDTNAWEYEDVTKQLGITKYEPPVTRVKLRAGRQASKRQSNPNFHRYTKWPNIKNVVNLFRNDEEVVITEKIHGTNFRAGWVKPAPTTWWGKLRKLLGLLPEYEFVFGSHNVQLTDLTGNDVYASTVRQYDLKNRLPKGIVVYGEIYGAGVQKGYSYGLKDETKLAVFDIEIEGLYADYLRFRLIADELELDPVPLLEINYYGEIRALSELCQGKSCIDNNTVREGCVIKTSMGERGAKVINPEYLLKHDNTDFH